MTKVRTIKTKFAHFHNFTLDAFNNNDDPAWGNPAWGDPSA